MKKVLSIVLSLVMVLCMIPTMAFAAEDVEASAYTDIAGQKCEAAVELLTELDVVDGYGDGTYGPDVVVTRAEMAKLIVALLGLNPASSTTNFTDMGEAEWAIPYVGYAESLGIIMGYGDGRFGPNDPVTYDQAITMIVRAIGYTEDCNEMQGNWPAVFVQKANELGILKNIDTTGNEGAIRGDIAIMLANALDVVMVYADKEGETQKRNDVNGDPLTVRENLIKDGDKEYRVVNDYDIAHSTKNINELLGAAGEIVTDEDDNVISVSDIKSTFMTGKFNADGTVFTSDGTDYTVGSSVLKELNAKGKVVDNSAGYVDGFENAADKANVTTSGGGINTTWTGTGNVTISCTVSGSTVTGIFAIVKWVPTAQQKISESDAAQIDNNNKLLNVKFKEDVNGDINENSFILNGVDSIDQITEDHVVYVFRNPDTKNIAKIEVGTEIVTGEITKNDLAASKVTDRYVVIEGTKYNLAENNTIASGVLDPENIVNLYLDYSGKVFAADIEDGTAGNYALVLAADSYNSSVLASTKVQLMTADGVKIFTVNTNKINTAAKYAPASVGNIVEYSLDSEGQIKELEDVTLNDATGEKVTAKGYLLGAPVSDAAVIFTAPVDATSSNNTPVSAAEFDLRDTDKLSVIEKDALIDTEIDGDFVYVLDDDNNIDFLMISSATTSDDVYGVVTGIYKTSDGDGASYIINKEAEAEADIDGAVVTASAILYKIEKKTDGSVAFVQQSPVASAKTFDVSGNKVSSTPAKYLADDVVIYIFDGDKLDSVDGATYDLTSDDNISVELYVTTTTGDNAGLVTHVIIKR